MTLNQVLAAVDSALSMLKSVANTPGVNMLPYVSTLSSAIAAVQAASAAGKNILPYIEAIRDTFSGTTPTPADLAALDAKIAALEQQVDAPLPPAEDGEDD